MKKLKQQRTVLSVCVASILYSSVVISPPAFSADNRQKENTPKSTLGEINVTHKNKKDEAGYDAQYEKDISNIYIGKDMVERYRGSSPADVLKNAVGVYSGDARNSGALDPNIRGIQGQGRVPVTIDGTEQAITVYRGYNGANNRNYLDPNLISSIEIEKGASLSRDVKSSTGGGIAINTLSIGDIVPEGDTFGINVKLETRSNSTPSHASTSSYSPGNDYRYDPTYNDIKGPFPFSDTSIERPPKTSKNNHFPGFNDNAFRIGFGWRTDPVDLLFAYSYRNQGNYFAGKGGAHRYNAPISEKDADNLGNNYQNVSGSVGGAFGATRGVDPFMPYAARIFKPGNEVPNTSNEMKSVLLKSTFRFYDDQALQFGFRDTRTQFGDIMPSRLGTVPWVSAGILSSEGALIPQWPLSDVHLQAANATYKWKPEDNRWIDFNLNAWLTRTDSDTNTGWGYPRTPLYSDSKYDSYLAFGKDPRYQHLYPNEVLPDPTIDGSLVSTSLTNSRNNRYGVDLSNKMKLTPKLDLTLMGSFQYETLDSSDNRYKSNTNDWFSHRASFSTPRKGKRQENSIAFNFDYRPTSWLSLSAGAKRVSYWSHDDMLDEMIQAKLHNEKWVSIPDQQISGVNVKYLRLATEEETQTLQKIAYNADKYPTPSNIMEFFAISSAQRKDFRALNITDEQYALIKKTTVIKDGKYEYNKYSGIGQKPDNARVNPFGLTPNTFYVEETVPVKYQSGKLNSADDPYYNGTVDLNKKVKNTAKAMPSDSNIADEANAYAEQYNYVVGRQILEKRELKKAETRRDHAWAPVLSASVFLNDNARIYGRYAESVRMPSIFEDTIGFSGFQNIAGYQFKPERAKTTEIGFVYDLKSALNAERNADFRINWYHTDIDNVFDRDGAMFFVQMDKMKLSGIEAMARYDNGNVFINAGLDYNLNYKVCDKSQRLSYDLNNTQGIPECIDGGFPGGYLRTTIPPRYSINANVGARLLDEKLEIGSRWLYHSSVVNKDEKKYPQLLTFGTNNNPMRWNPVLTVDAYVDYNLTKDIKLELTGENLTNRYYLDPLTRSMMPAPGRTVRFGVTAQF